MGSVHKEWAVCLSSTHMTSIIVGCPLHLASARASLLHDGAALFARLDFAGDGKIQYQQFVEQMQGLPKDDLVRYGLKSDDDITRFASALWDLKYGPLPSAGCSGLERAVYGRAPSHTILHEHCLDHETHSGPQGKATVTFDTRFQLTITGSEFMDLLSGVAAGVNRETQRETQRLRPASALQTAGITRQVLRRQEELLIDIDIPVRVGLRVVVSEWFRRSRRKNGWPDVSAGAIGTITRLVRVRHYVGWHYGTHQDISTAVRNKAGPVDSCHTVGDGIEPACWQHTEFESMFERKLHSHHAACLPAHIATAQNRSGGSSAFVRRSRPSRAVCSHLCLSHALSASEGEAVSSFNRLACTKVQILTQVLAQKHKY